MVKAAAYTLGGGVLGALIGPVALDSCDVPAQTPIVRSVDDFTAHSQDVASQLRLRAESAARLSIGPGYNSGLPEIVKAQHLRGQAGDPVSFEAATKAQTLIFTGENLADQKNHNIARVILGITGVMFGSVVGIRRATNDLVQPRTEETTGGA